MQVLSSYVIQLYIGNGHHVNSFIILITPQHLEVTSEIWWPTWLHQKSPAQAPLTMERVLIEAIQ
jgi:hypothetical protein